MYKWGWQIEGDIISPITIAQMEKADYVDRYLSPSVLNARCGWHGVKYMIIRNKYGNIDEYACLIANEHDGASNWRWYNVSGGSLGEIAEEVWRGVFR